MQSRSDAAPTNVAVPERDGAFDVDLGSNLRGQTYAVYTRGGDIYRLDPRTQQETKITQLSAPDKTERNPTIQSGQIAFLRRDGGMDQLRIGQTNTHGAGSRLLLKRKSIQSIELGAKQVAWVDDITTRAPSSRQRVHILGIASGKDHIVYEAGSGGASYSVVAQALVHRRRIGLPLDPRADRHRRQPHREVHAEHRQALRMHRARRDTHRSAGSTTRSAPSSRRASTRSPDRAAANASTPACSTAPSSTPVR